MSAVDVGLLIAAGIMLLAMLVVCCAEATGWEE